MSLCQVQASDESLRTVCFAAVKGSNREKTEVLMTLSRQVLSGCSANTPYWRVDKERPAAALSAHAHLSGNGHCFEKSQELCKWLKRKEYNRYARVSCLLGVWMCVCVCVHVCILKFIWMNKNVLVLKRDYCCLQHMHLWCMSIQDVWHTPEQQEAHQWQTRA